MKFKIILFFVTLFFLAIEAQAQPQKYNGFYPYQACSFSPTEETILVGRLVSSEDVKDSSVRRFAFYRGTIAVEKILKGSLKENIEILWGEDGWFSDLKKGDERIFIINRFNLNNSEFLLSRKWSLPLNSYTEKEKDNIFSVINSRIKRYPEAPPLTGIVIQKKSSPETHYDKVFTTFGYDYAGFNLMEGITIEAKRETDGKTFRVKTNKEGYYVFDELPDGDYHVYPLLPQEYERVSQAYVNLTYKVHPDSCHDLTVFKVDKK